MISSSAKIGLWYIKNFKTSSVGQNTNSNGSMIHCSKLSALFRRNPHFLGDWKNNPCFLKRQKLSWWNFLKILRTIEKPLKNRETENRYEQLLLIRGIKWSRLMFILLVFIIIFRLGIRNFKTPSSVTKCSLEYFHINFSRIYQIH